MIETLCTDWRKLFTQSGDLQGHEWVHTGLKPYSRTNCRMSFTQVGDIQRHQGVHTGL